MIGALPYIIGTIVAFGAIALYFGFVKKTWCLFCPLELKMRQCSQSVDASSFFDQFPALGFERVFAIGWWNTLGNIPKNGQVGNSHWALSSVLGCPENFRSKNRNR